MSEFVLNSSSRLALFLVVELQMRRIRNARLKGMDFLTWPGLQEVCEGIDEYRVTL